MLKGFRDFILRGNVVDLAVALVIGAAFAAVVTSFVTNILTPLLGLLGVPDLSTWSYTFANGSELKYGAFLNSLIAFFLIALAIYFFLIVPSMRLRPKPAAPVETKSCPFCATDIPVSAKRCPNCTSNLE
jgi:large conductance mechanosensitive channel